MNLAYSLQQQKKNPIRIYQQVLFIFAFPLTELSGWLYINFLSVNFKMHAKLATDPDGEEKRPLLQGLIFNTC